MPLKDIAGDYIRANFRPDDRLVIVLIQKRSGVVTTRVSTAEKIASPEYQAWLKHMNAQRYEIYISMNSLRPEARGRHKADIDQIRHVYLDFDTNGTEAVAAMRARADMPAPGADVAASDCARVFRLPGFYNHKYSSPHFVTVENLSGDVYLPSQFPDLPAEGISQAVDLERRRASSLVGRDASTVGASQSERDWAFALRALGRGETPEDVVRAIEAYRGDKANPGYYARHTVERAQSVLRDSDFSYCENSGVHHR